MRKPAKGNNDWLGIMGVGKAKLFDDKQNIVGYALDTPNAVAYAMKINSRVKKAVGILGEYNIEDINKRMEWILNDAELHKDSVRFL